MAQPQTMVDTGSRGELLKDLLESYASMCPDETWHALDAKWWACCKAYLGVDGPVDQVAHPGPIDNRRLQGEHEKVLRNDIQENVDYVLVHEKVWEMILGWFGGGPSFPRVVITVGAQMERIIELYPTLLRLVLVDSETGNPDPVHISDEFFSRGALLSEVLRRGKEVFASTIPVQDDAGEGCGEGTPQAKARIWMPNSSIGNNSAEAGGVTESCWSEVVDSGLKDCLELYDLAIADEVLFEWCGLEGKWPRASFERDWTRFRVGDDIDALDNHQKWYESTIRDIKDGKLLIHFKNWDPKWDEWIPADDMTRLAKKGTHTNGPYVPLRRSHIAGASSSIGMVGSVPGKPNQRGVVGLRNIGNTCFMNSTLQCLSNAPGLTEFFLNGTYLTQINRTNPLGWQGKVAESYGELLKDLWHGQYRVVNPRDFKYVIGEFQPRFRGYQQQDSSELLSFLLDGLHEDLNRVQNKPLTCAVESNGRSDEVVAAEAWETHLKRNQSVIVDTCQGQCKSTLVCPSCNKVCITFDPFMSLTLSLPSTSERSLRFTALFPSKDLAPTVYQVTVEKASNIRHFRSAVAALLGVDICELIIAEVWNNDVHRLYKDSDSTEDIRANDDIWVFHVPYLSCSSQDLLAMNNLNVANDANDANVMNDVHGAVSTFEYLSVDPHDVGAEGGAPTVPLSPFVPPVRFGDASPVPVTVVNHVVMEHRQVGSESQAFGVPFIVALPRGDRVPTSVIIQRVHEAVKLFAGDDLNVDELTVTIAGKSVSKYGPGSWSSRSGHLKPLRNTDHISVTERVVLNVIWSPEQAKHYRKVWIESPEVHESAVVNSSEKPQVGLDDCFRTYTQEETLREEDAWYCPQCKAFRCATKKMELWKLPDVLIVHFKRFLYSGMWREKIQTYIDFPVDGLSLADWTPSIEAQGRVYDLFAVSNHYGSLGGGHYTACAKNLMDGQWYNFDDASVSPIGVEQIKTNAAYVLFYSVRKTSA